ncbi:hypothetical protein BD410DRAFT_876473 [Rickenella mellea]|uniref:Uncharacterized protein n=1 Tax=Rickenella mellea TaxID=50990 RepID=A0A4Y7PWU5_9AGAM|nr:hypothetical protein BD410DRAFT_876473 [Rickenella mellea]
MIAWTHPLDVEAKDEPSTIGGLKHVRQEMVQNHAGALPSIALQLPPELVGDIMAIVAQNQFLTDSLLLPRSSRYAWIKLCHICQSWRQIALGCPILWSYIDTRWDLLVNELIRRSHTVPLTVFVWFEDKCTSSGVIAINKALVEMHRIKELHLIANNLDLYFPGLRLPLKAPLLEVLSLESAYQTNIPGTLIESTDIATNRLRSLSLTNITMAAIPSNPKILRPLQYLRIFPKAIRTTPISEVLTVLAFCPELIEFEYYSHLNVIHDVAALAETRIVNLRHLRRFRLSTNDPASLALLNHISIPHNVSLCISGNRPSLLFSRPNFPPSLLVACNSLIINVASGDRGEGFILSTSTKCGGEYEPYALELFTQTSYFHMYSSNPSNVVPRIRYIELSDSDDAPFRMEKAYHDILRSVPLVETLKGSFKRPGPAITLIGALSESMAGRLCPNLRILNLQLVVPEFQTEAILQELRFLLRSRIETSAPLTVLDLSGCTGITPNHGQVHLIRSLVETLILPELP